MQENKYSKGMELEERGKKEDNL